MSAELLALVTVVATVIVRELLAVREAHLRRIGARRTRRSDRGAGGRQTPPE